VEAMASIGDYAFNIDPESVSWNHSVISVDKETVGGKVVQVLGIKHSEITVAGSFGNRRLTSSGQRVGGWQEQQDFLESVKKQARSYAADPEQAPLRFIYPQMGWDFQVRLKNYTNGNQGPRSVRVSADIANPKWQLTLHVVRDNALLKERAIDSFIERVANGMGWRPTAFQGPYTQTDAFANIAASIRPGETTEQWFSRIYAEGQGIFTNQGGTGENLFPDNYVTDSGPDPTIMGKPMVTSRRVKAQYEKKYVEGGGKQREISAIGLPVSALIDLYYEVGNAEGVRPDYAFAQAILETGHFTSPDTRINNFAGIAHYNNANSGNPFATPREGVVAHIQLLKRFALGDGAPMVLPSVPNNNAGARAERWSGLAGTWAVPPTGYWGNIQQIYRDLGGDGG
jgi:hypothetical protein